MTPTEVLKMLKGKIDAAGVNKCNYAIETSDIEAINQALLLYDVSNPLSCVGCIYNNTTNDELCGTCGDTYKNKAT